MKGPAGDEGTPDEAAEESRGERPDVLPPAIVLVAPQLGENIGAVARAMWNCGLRDLRLVEPRDGWPNESARATASGADPVLEAVRVFPTVEEAIGDCRFVYATSARRRDMAKITDGPRRAAREIRERERRGERTGVLFGRERIGLTNDEVALADRLLLAPLNPEFTSLNLAQAVLLLVWEWWAAGLDEDAEAPTAEDSRLEVRDSRPATRDELIGFFDHLERELERTGFFRVEEMKPIMIRNLRNVFLRAAPTEQEIRTLHGVVSRLADRRGRGA